MRDGSEAQPDGGGAKSSKAASKAGFGTKVQVLTQMRNGSEAQADGGGAESSKSASKAGLEEAAGVQEGHATREGTGGVSEARGVENGCALLEGGGILYFTALLSCFATVVCSYRSEARGVENAPGRRW